MGWVVKQKSILSLVAIVAVVLLGFQNCAKVNFAKDSEALLSSAMTPTDCDSTVFGDVCPGEPPVSQPGARAYFYRLTPNLDANGHTASVGQYSGQYLSAHMGMLNSNSVIPNLTLNATTINVPLQDWSAGFPGFAQLTEWFGLCYDASWVAPSNGNYTIVTSVDDALSVSIDGVLVGENNYGSISTTPAVNRGSGSGPGPMALRSVPLMAGTHSVQIKYYQAWPVRIQAQVWILPAGVNFTSMSQLTSANLMQLGSPVPNAPLSCPK